jgi:hypothetical protein
MRAYYALGEPQKAYTAAARLANERFKINSQYDRYAIYSPHRAEAWLVMARIHHARGELDQAVELYQKNGSTEAREIVAFLTEPGFELEDIARAAVGTKPELKIRSKNLKQITLKAHRVDLMTLLAVKKDLRDVTAINLTGIDPQLSTSVTFKEGVDYRWHDRSVPLDLTEKGVYLVVAESDGFARSCLVVVSDLEVRVQLDGRNRVNVYVNERTGLPAANAFVKVAIGDKIVDQGNTDARGLRTHQGTWYGTQSMTVVVERDGHYAVWRR